MTDPLFKDYTSTDGFGVIFPGLPRIDRLSLPVEGHQVPYTISSASVDRTRDYRAVIVSDDSGVPVSARDLSPETALNRVVQNVPGAQLISSRHTTLAGHDAMVGDYTALTGGQTSQSVDCFVEIIQVGTHLYGVTCAGISRASFDTFANSFHLTQS